MLTTYRRLLCLAWGASVFAAHANPAPEKIVVRAGDFDRREVPVVFPLPGKAAGAYSLVSSSGERVPLQVDAAGRASFIEPSLAKGSTKTYRIDAAETGAKEVTAAKRGDLVDVAFGSQRIVSYQMQPGAVPAGVPESFRHGAHLHPVFSPSGRLVTGNHPADHRWHRGIWFAWTHTQFEGRAPDFWNMGKEKDGKLTGEVRFDRLDSTWSGPVAAGFRSQHRWIDHTSGAAKEALHERWEVSIYRPLNAASPVFALDFVSTQTCASDAPVKLPKYHYGGLGVRGNSLWDPVDKVTMLTSNGDDRIKGDGTKAKWVYIGGDVDGAQAGLVVLIHRENFRFPQPLRLNPKNPQLCVAPSADGDWEITPGTPYVSRYRIVAMDGKPEPAEIERLWADYATPPGVAVR